MSWHDLERVIAAACKLQIRGDLDPSIAAYEVRMHFVSAIADLYMAGARSKSDLKLMKEIGRSADQLSKKLQNLDLLAECAYSRKGGPVLWDHSLSETLRTLSQTSKHLVAAGVHERFKQPSLAIAICARDVFEFLTGKRATAFKRAITNKRDSAFTRFLADVFEALYFDASAEYYAERAAQAGYTDHQTDPAGLRSDCWKQFQARKATRRKNFKNRKSAPVL